MTLNPHLSIQIYFRLFRSKGCLNAKHIINNMLHMVELNPKHIPLVYDIFKTPNLYEGDYLSWNPDKQFDIIIGNPPFNHRVGIFQERSNPTC